MIGKRYFIAAFVLLLSCVCANAQHAVADGLEFDKMVLYFGEILHKSGSVAFTFTLKNSSSKPAVIYNVVSTGGGTVVKWTREPIRPGQSGTVSVT